MRAIECNELELVSGGSFSTTLANFKKEMSNFVYNNYGIMHGAGWTIGNILQSTLSIVESIMYKDYAGGMKKLNWASQYITEFCDAVEARYDRLIAEAK